MGKQGLGGSGDEGDPGILLLGAPYMAYQDFRTNSSPDLPGVTPKFRAVAGPPTRPQPLDRFTRDTTGFDLPQARVDAGE